jgi:hypothetical protein
MTNHTSHDQLEELFAADALDGLTAVEHEEMERIMASHGPNCAECIRLVTEYREVAAQLAMAVDPVAMSAAAEQHLIAAIGAADVVVTPLARARPERPDGSRRGRSARPGAGGGRRWVAAVAVAAAMALFGGLVGYQIGRPSSGQSQLLEAQAAFNSFVARPGVQVASFTPRGERRLAVAYVAGQAEGWVIGKLPAPPKGRVYELWFGPSLMGPMHPAGTFEPSDGTVLSQATLSADFGALAVSIEPDGGSPQPTTQPIFATTIS